MRSDPQWQTPHRGSSSPRGLHAALKVVDYSRYCQANLFGLPWGGVNRFCPSRHSFQPTRRGNPGVDSNRTSYGGCRSSFLGIEMSVRYRTTRARRRSTAQGCAAPGRCAWDGCRMAGWARPSSHTTVLLDSRTNISPWVSKARVGRDGVLWIGVLGEAPPAGLQVQALSHGLWWAVHKGNDKPSMPAALMNH